MQNFRSRMGWALAGALALALIATLARTIQAGPLDPPGPVASTMKTLGDLVPAWHQTLASSGCGSARWNCVMGGAAVLDNETGLVWEKTPTSSAGENWFAAQTSCTSAATGNRFGWRLPAAEELLSLRDGATGDGLPAGHPFSGISGGFWSSTAAPDDERYAEDVTFPAEFGPPQTLPKDFAAAGAWCVRGGRGENAQTPGDLTSWSKKLPATGLDSCHTRRFACVFDNNEGVLDHETGLVWERYVGQGAAPFNQAQGSCAQSTLGGRSGWRLPTISELSSLLDPAQTAPAYSLPPGHPFIGVNTSLASFFWSSTLYIASPSNVLVVTFIGTSTGFPGYVYGETMLPNGGVWCVRGADTQ
jgi:hypothetical protein